MRNLIHSIARWLPVAAATVSLQAQTRYTTPTLRFTGDNVTYTWALSPQPPQTDSDYTVSGPGLAAVAPTVFRGVLDEPSILNRDNPATAPIPPWIGDTAESKWIGPANGGSGAAAHPIDETRHEQQCQGHSGGGGAWPEPMPGQAQGEGKEPQTHHGARHAEGDHRFAAKPVAEGADQGRECELRQGIAAPQQAQHPAVVGEVGQQIGQQGKDQGLPQPVVEQGEKGAEKDGAARAAQGLPQWRLISFPWQCGALAVSR
jgi:hypothetical protein